MVLLGIQRVNSVTLERKIQSTSLLPAMPCRSLLSHAPLNLPDPEHDPSAFTEIILGIDWIDGLEAQAFLIHYITDLKQKRSEILINQPCTFHLSGVLS